MKNREASNDLINLLSKSDTFSTAEDLAQKMNLSSKSIYRLIFQINQSEKYQGRKDLIISKRGKGIRLSNLAGQRILPFADDRRAVSEVSPFGRRNHILLQLLYSSPKDIRISDLYEHYYVSDSVVNNDETYMNEILRRFNLKILRLKRTMSISGQEKLVRQAISFIADTSESFDLKNLFADDSSFYNQRDSDFVDGQIRQIEKNLHTIIPHPYDVNLYSHILILISRYRKTGRHVSHDTDRLSEDELNAIQSHPQIYDIAKNICLNIEKYIRTKLPDSDTYYIFEYLLSSRAIYPDKISLMADKRVVRVAEEYLKIVSDYLGIKNNFVDIRTDLINHIQPMLNRIRYSLNIKNNLLSQIQSEYADIFEAVRQASHIIAVKERLPKITDDEIGFLVLYFAQSLEKNVPRIKVLIMCTTGVGTAELLRVKISKYFPSLDIVGVISEREFRSKNYSDVDLVISTIPIIKSSIRSIVVSAIFNNRDKTLLDQEVSEIEQTKNSR